MAVAPKRAPKASVNETLRDRGIAHAVFLERLKDEEGRRVLKHLDDEVIPDLTARLTKRLAAMAERGQDLASRGTNRLRDMLEVMQESVDSWRSGLASELAERTAEIGMAEATWQNRLIQSVIPITWDTVVPAAAMIANAIRNSPIDGVLLKDVVGRLGAGTKAHLEKALRIGLTEGESIDRITARIRKATDFTRTSAEAVARTAVGHASNIGRQAYYGENEDIIKGIKWVDTLDTRTCLRCAYLGDSKPFPVKSGPRPPRHINCRCTTIPVLKSMKELGFNLNDFPAGTRASMNGQVPANETFNSWLQKMPPGVQDEALGPARAALFRSGKLEVKDFVNVRGETYTLKELAKREAAAFATVPTPGTAAIVWKEKAEVIAEQTRLYAKGRAIMETREELAQAVRQYQRQGVGSSSMVNGYLRGGEAVPAAVRNVPLLDEAIGGSPLGGARVFRGASQVGSMKLPTDLAEARTMIGQIMLEPGFSSSSLNHSNFVGNGRSMIEINGASHGLLAMAARSSKAIDKSIDKEVLPEGAEVLLPRGMSYRITGVSEEAHPTIPGLRILVYRADVVPTPKPK